MTVDADKRLFWFLKDNSRLDLNKPAMLDLYVQQIITAGTFQDVQAFLKNVSFEQLRGSLARINRFLPPEVKMFWEHYLGNH